MSNTPSSQSSFLQRLVSMIEENLADENFGVSELADSIGMSRSNLLRKVKQETNESVSVFIRNERLKKAQAFLKAGDFTVSEVSFKVGFSSTSYFTKCFKEYFGYTPGEAVNQIESQEEDEEIVLENKTDNKKRNIAIALVSVLALVLALFILISSEDEKIHDDLSKTLAVLPFKNDSPDSNNVYFMNGLMEAILDDFQKIEDLKVTSRTSVEKYRTASLTIPELSTELNVNYIVEGSGQKIGDEIILTIQLIEAQTDKHLWSKRYQRELKDIFELQSDVAKSIANEINAIITPEENQRIDKIPTNNLVAYDYFLRGTVLLNDETGNGLDESIEQFKKAIQEDSDFAGAYAHIAIAYYYIDLFRAEKKHAEGLKKYADKAILLDPELGESLIASGMYHMQQENYEQAIIAFEKVLKYYPNKTWIHNFLSNIYAFILPDSEKYLLHALKGIESAVEKSDSTNASYTYLHLSNALIQSGFIDEANNYAKKSLALNPNNHYTQYLKVYLNLASDFDLKRARVEIIKVLEQDSSKIDVIQEIAKVCYTMNDYKQAWKYYEKMLQIKDQLELKLYESEDLKIGFVLNKLGDAERSKQFYDQFLKYAENNQSIYQALNLASYYAAIGETDKAMTYFKEFAKNESFQYWFVLFLETDPILGQMKGHPGFKATADLIKQKFWQKHEETEKMLEEKGILILGNGK
jgi:TolB-like protein/AraC-like DNA-binding protein/Tfp pilus assembly protein PilF